MMSLLTSLLLTLNLTSGQPIKVAVIDTGSNSLHKLPLCKTGHVDFTRSAPKYYTSKEIYEGEYVDFKDRKGHGTNISHLLHKQTNKANYCQVIIKYYDDSSKTHTLLNTVKAIRHSIKEKVHIINYSSGGTQSANIEKMAIRDALINNIIVVASAGNNGADLDKECSSFPVCYYHDIIVVGSGFDANKKASYSNYGKIVDIWINGSHQEANGVTMSGTSQSTAIATGRLIKTLDKLRDSLNE